VNGKTEIRGQRSECSVVANRRRFALAVQGSYRKGKKVDNFKSGLDRILLAFLLRQPRRLPYVVLEEKIFSTQRALRERRKSAKGIRKEVRPNIEHSTSNVERSLKTFREGRHTSTSSGDRPQVANT